MGGSSLLGGVDLNLLEAGRDGLVDLVGLPVVNIQSQKILGGSELELGGVGLLGSLDNNLVAWELVLVLSSHHFNELFQVFDFLWLQNN